MVQLNMARQLSKIASIVQKKLQHILSRVVLIVMAGTASAQSYTYTDIFTLAYPDNDLSIKMLQLLFGQVGTSLNVTTQTPAQNPVMSNLFLIFNTGVLTMLMVLVIYSIFFQAMNVSQDGSQGMSRQSSAFLTFRIVLGSSLLLPAFNSGYSGIQVMVMNVVVYGIAFANYAWTETYQIAMGEISTSSSETTELEKYDMLPLGLTNTWADGSTASFDPSNTDRCNKPESAYVTATDLFAMAMCTNLYQKMATENGYTDASYSLYYQTPSSTSDEMKCSSKSGYYLCFGNISDSNVYATLCGSIAFSDATQQAAISEAASKAMSSAADYAAGAYSATYVDTDGEFTTSGSNIFDCSDINNMSSAPTWASSYIEYDNICTVQGQISEIALAYAESLVEYYGDTTTTESASDDDNYKSGWATAGQYFQTLAMNIAAGEVSTSVSSADASTSASSMLAQRGVLSSYNYGDHSGSSAASNCTNNSAMANTPACTLYCECLDLDDDPGSGDAHNLTNFYTKVLPSAKLGETLSPETYGYYSAAASAVVAESAQALMDESESASTSTVTVSDSTSSVQNIAACQVAISVAQASEMLNSDMPSYLKASNTMNPNQITFGWSSSASDNYSSSSALYQKTDFATTNMMLSVNMVIEALTGMKMFSETITTGSKYKSASNASNTCTNCSKILDLGDDCSNAETFLSDLADNGYLVMGKSEDSADTTRAGLFGMVYMEEQGWTKYADPLANLTNLGVTMIASAVFYYMTTMEQLFDAIMTISAWYTGIVSAAKLALAATNAVSSGRFEPVLVGTGALVEGFFNMLFELDKFALELFLPLGTAVAGILFVQGVVLGVFLPFLATIIYVFGVLGWLFAVVEAMVASGLVAMGLTHPEGHDLLGQTEQALMLLLGVFVRPIAMIIGLFFAISISQASMNLVNTGFLYVISDYFNITMQSGGAGTNVGTTYSKVCTISSIGILLVYTYIAYSILEMCYGLISQIPDRILRWIGGPEQQSQSTQMAKQIKQDTAGSAKEGASGAGQATRAPSVSPVSAGITIAGAQKPKSDNDMKVGR